MRTRTSAILASGLGAALGLAAGVANAADETGKWYINPMYGYTWLDDARNVDDDDSWGLGIGKHLSKHWSLELNGFFGADDYNNDATGLSLEQSAYSLDALVVFARENTVSPYITFGAGYIENDFNGVDIDGPLAQVGLGLMIDVGQNAAKTFVFQLRPEAKVRYDWADTPAHDDFHDYIVNLGFAFNFGPPPYEPPPIEDAKRQYVELFGSALVMNTYLKVALLVVSLVAMGLVALNFYTVRAYRDLKPLVIRIDDIRAFLDRAKIPYRTAFATRPDGLLQAATGMSRAERLTITIPPPAH